MSSPCLLPCFEKSTCNILYTLAEMVVISKIDSRKDPQNAANPFAQFAKSPIFDRNMLVRVLVPACENEPCSPSEAPESENDTNTPIYRPRVKVGCNYKFPTLYAALGKYNFCPRSVLLFLESASGGYVSAFIAWIKGSYNKLKCSTGIWFLVAALVQRADFPEHWIRLYDTPFFRLKGFSDNTKFAIRVLERTLGRSRIPEQNLLYLTTGEEATAQACYERSGDPVFLKFFNGKHAVKRNDGVEKSIQIKMKPALEKIKRLQAFIQTSLDEIDELKHLSGTQYKTSKQPDGAAKRSRTVRDTFAKIENEALSECKRQRPNQVAPRRVIDYLNASLYGSHCVTSWYKDEPIPMKRFPLKE